MAFNINKLFPFLGIRAKLIVAFTALSFIPLVVVGAFGIHNNVTTMNDIAHRNLSNEVSLFNDRVRRFLIAVQTDLRYVSGSPGFAAFLRESQHGHGRDRSPARDGLLQDLTAFASSGGIYLRIRFIDMEHEECFRVALHDGRYEALAADSLGAGSLRFYEYMTSNLGAGKVAFAPVEVAGIDGGRTAAISAATRVFDETGTAIGILVADVRAGRFFEAVESGIALDPERVMAIVTNEGNIFYHSENKRDWNMLLSEPGPHGLFDGVPSDAVRDILSGGSGITSSPRRVVAYAPVFGPGFAGGNSYHIVESVDKEFIHGPAKRFANVFVGLLVVFLVVSVVLGFVATDQLAGPIRKLQRGAEIVAQGDYEHRLAIDTNDEIELLALQFNKMAQALSVREDLLAGEQRRLEEEVALRTRELQAEKEKLQAVLDNVSTAFILVDEEKRIISASAASKAVIGISASDAIGRVVDDVFPEGVASDGGDSEAVHDSSLLTFESDGNAPRLVEHSSTPIRVGARIASLEVFTDVTARKQMEANVVRAERLAATGEMAAIIAHEIRNSLTSVKMILQLQREDSVNEDERASLDVAIGSLRRTEDVVNDLLRFARPAQLQLREVSMNDIIADAVSFAKPFAEKHGIRIQVDLDAQLPNVHLDGQQMKEALINLLINAIQAVGDPGGRVEVTSARRVLDRDVNDIAYADWPGGTSEVNPGRISLGRGRVVMEACVRDTGPGISEQQARRVFDPFYTTKAGGTGLGLTMVKRTVNRHGGVISVANSPPGGALFTIMLPLEPAS